MSAHDGDDRPRRREPRYGVRTLVWLTLAGAALLASSVLNAQGIEGFGLLTFLGLVAGLVGATVNTVRGLRAFNGLPRG